MSLSLPPERDRDTGGYRKTKVGRGGVQRGRRARRNTRRRKEEGGGVVGRRQWKEEVREREEGEYR